MKAIALVSGGLDSILAARLIQQQGIEVIPLNFNTNFGCLKQDGKGNLRNPAKEAAKNLGLALKTVDISVDFIKLLKNPKYGYGANMNPCIDCKIMMLRRARQVMQETGASFIVTGEVLGQRPMSQHRRALGSIEKESGLEGLLLRPLSAKLLPETIPEKEGWVRPDSLLDFNGRSRKPQIALAKNFNLRDYPNAAGGCLLTDPEFVKRLKDFMAHAELDLNSLQLLKLGRHFRLSQDSKLIVGRNEKENTKIADLVKEADYLFMPQELAGPTALGRGVFGEDLIQLCCQIVCRYCDLDGKLNARIIYRRIPQKEEKIITAIPISEPELDKFRI